jgi:two-component system chemotaxis response regulator CheY
MTKYNILIVDDSMIIRRMIERYLQNQSIESIHHANNGKQALELVQTHDFQVITMDITMPEMDGLECIEKILNCKPQSKILVISALADRATAVQAVKIGAEGFLLKPFNEELLLEAIQELFEP